MVYLPARSAYLDILELNPNDMSKVRSVGSGDGRDAHLHPTRQSVWEGTWNPPHPHRKDARDGYSPLYPQLNDMSMIKLAYVKCSHCPGDVLCGCGASLSGSAINAQGLRTMSTKTPAQKTDQVLSEATITDLREESKTVKGLTLKIHETCFSFKAGQWLDMMIPGIDRVGGYSMCSSPGHLLKHSTLDLAVKYSDHPPTHWVHSQCKVGDKVSVKSDGTFYYDPQPSDKAPPILLIAGGVGINPLICIVKHIADLGKTSRLDNSAFHPGSVRLLYSACNEEELIFKTKLLSLCEEEENIKCQFFVTQERPTDSAITYGRICSASIKTALLNHGAADVICYVCGPPPMIDDMEAVLLNLGVAKQNIHYEKWWK